MQCRTVENDERRLKRDVGFCQSSRGGGSFAESSTSAGPVLGSEWWREELFSVERRPRDSKLAGGQIRRWRRKRRWGRRRRVLLGSAPHCSPLWSDGFPASVTDSVSPPAVHSAPPGLFMLITSSCCLDQSMASNTGKGVRGTRGH